MGTQRYTMRTQGKGEGGLGGGLGGQEDKYKGKGALWVTGAGEGKVGGWYRGGGA